MRSIITSIFFLLLFSTSFSQVYWQDQNSPLDAQYYAIDKTSANFYGSNGVASGSGQRFYHRAGTGSWNQVTTDLPTGSLSGLWALNSGSLLTCHSYITAVTFYRSTNNGANWTLVYTVPIYKGVAYTMVQSSDNSIYLVNNQNAEDIRKSIDDGATWTTLPNTTHAFKNLVTTGGTALFGLALTTPGWLHTSTDGGVTWTITGYAGYNLGLGAPGNVFGTPNGNLYFNNYFKSTDGGNNWTAITTAPAGPGIRFADKANNIFVTNDPTNFFRSSDAGQTYTDVVNGLGLSPLVSMQYIYTPNDGEVYVSTMEHKLYKYGLANSIQESTGITNLEIFPNPVSALAVLIITNLGEIKLADTELKFYDVLGNEVKITFTRDTDSFIVRRENLSTGLYFCQLKKGNTILANTKFIIQ